MTGTRCPAPIEFADVVDYWAGDLTRADEDRIEEHMFTCADCAREVAAVEGLSLGAVLERLYGEVGRLVSVRVNVPLSDAVRKALPARISDPPKTLGGRAVKRVQTTDGLKLHLDGGAWVLVRPSGTEPVARLYVEAPDGATLDALRDTALHHFFS